MGTERKTQKKTFRGCLWRLKDMESPNECNGKKRKNQLTQVATRNERKE
jgi:hypothetical protein